MNEHKIIDTGGPAFQMFRQHALGRVEEIDAGMTLRDWFAGQVLVAGGTYLVNFLPAEAAKKAYAIADAMIAARSTTGTRGSE